MMHLRRPVDGGESRSERLPSLIATLVGLIIGVLIGVLAATWRGRRKRESLHLELAVLRAQVKTDEQIERERQAALDQTIERLRSTLRQRRRGVAALEQRSVPEAGARAPGPAQPERGHRADAA